jgi:hemerythrin superfamily protein
MPRTAQKDAVDFLHDQHDEVRSLFLSVATTVGRPRRRAFESLVRLLAMHETAEEMVLYPAVKAGGDAGKRAAKARLAEEDRAKKTLAALEKLDPDSPQFADLFVAFRADVEAHAEREEAEIFPMLESTQDEGRLEMMTKALRAAEAVAPTHAHASAPESALGNIVTGPAVAVVDRVRDAIKSASN